jgi:hypothetical protein
MFNPIVAYGAGAALLLGLFGGWSIRDWKADADQLQAMEAANRQREKLQAKYDAIALGYEADRAQAETNSITRQTELRTIYRETPVLGDCAAPAAARGLLEDSIREANARATGKSPDAVPAATESPQPAL